ncbi:hypothetical protein ACN38_g10082 [Penicillium nordicum]|uniref:Uncharacterized protein n=1 Tax=Penicillium nordicum TaxID=229535 RepID=A0A0M8NX18_9EURO|nr:hypothetical protein ACN38_g10082 [Penicillium nordicum]
MYACPYVPARVKVSLTVKWHRSPARKTQDESAQKVLTVGRQGLITRGQLYGLWYCQRFLMIEGCGGLKSEIVGNRWQGYWEGLKRPMKPLKTG